MEEQKNDNGVFLTLFLAVFIDLLGFGIIIPVLPFLVERFPVDEQGVRLALILSIYSFVQFIFAPIWGRLSDRIGRRPVILIGLLGSALSFFLFGITDSYTMFLVSRGLAGFFTSATLPTARAYVADITPPEDRAKRFGLLGAAFGLGFVIGPALGGLLASDPVINFLSSFGTVYIQLPPALVAALLSVLNFLKAYSDLPEPVRRISSDEVDMGGFRKLGKVMFFPGVAVLIIIFGINSLTFSGFEAAFSLVIKDIIGEEASPFLIGLFFFYVGVWSIIIQGKYIGPIVDKLGEEQTIRVGLILTAVGFSLSVFFTFNVFIFAATLTPIAVGIAMINPPLNSALSKRIPADMQGGGLGINSSIGSLGRIVGPLIGGAMLDLYGFAIAFFLAAVVVVILAVVSLFGLSEDQVKDL